MLVSVIMSVFNNIQFLHESIESILNQSYHYLEFIIIDDGSTEPVFDLIKGYADTRIVALRNDKNIGLTKSLNICLDKVYGDFVVRHDADDISLPNRIEEQLKHFEKGVGFVSSWASSIDNNGDGINGFVDKHLRCSEYNLNTGYKKHLSIVDPTTMYSIEAIRKVGYFDERMYLGQTCNYNRRILKFFNGRIIPEVLYLRREHNNQVGKRVLRFLKFKNRAVNWRLLARKFAYESPIIKERTIQPWENQ